MKPSVKVALIAGGAVAVGFAAWRVVKAVKNAKAEREAKKILKNDTAVAEDFIAGRKLTDVEAQKAADSLYGAMKDMGTDLTTIKKILVDDNPTAADIIQINSSFGIREYGTFGEPWWGNGDPLDLRGWLKKEISSSTTLYSLINTRFQMAGLPL